MKEVLGLLLIGSIFFMLGYVVGANLIPQIRQTIKNRKKNRFKAEYLKYIQNMNLLTCDPKDPSEFPSITELRKENTEIEKALNKMKI